MPSFQREANLKNPSRGRVMEALLILGVLIFIGYALYRSGKRVGSRKGYKVGFSRRRRRRR
jgi:hypothetical protein